MEFFRNETDKDVWNSFLALNKRENFLSFRKHDYSEKLEALAVIGQKGRVDCISRLIIFLHHRKKELSESAANAIRLLFTRIKNKSEYYDSLKHCSIREWDIDNFRRMFTAENYRTLLVIASFNSSGYVREKAVSQLIELSDPECIPFIIFRLADWVHPVRVLAHKGLAKYMQPAYLDYLIRELGIIEWLTTVERVDLGPIYQQLTAFIFGTNSEYLIERFSSYPEKLRLIIARNILDSDFCSAQCIKLFSGDKNFLIRKLALRHFEQLDSEDIERLLRDKSPIVRMETLYHLRNTNLLSDIILPYLADKSSRVRNFARYTLRLSGINFAEYYHQCLLEGTQIIGALAGLLDVDARQYAPTVKKFLGHSLIRVRKAAFITYSQFSENDACQYAVDRLGIAGTGERSLFIRFLAANGGDEVLEKARELFASGDFELKKSMLILFNRTGGWKVIADILLAMNDSDESIRQLAADYANKWKINTLRLFTVPHPNDVIRTNNACQYISTTIGSNDHSTKQLLNEIQFMMR